MVEVLRQATGEDVALLADLINAAYAVEEFFVCGPRIDVTEVERLLLRGLFLIAGAGGAPDGCVYLEPRGEIGYLGLLSVTPARQGEGLGHRLLRLGESRLERLGCTVIEIWVVNLRRELFPWYEKRGYRPVATQPFSAPERQRRPCHFVLMHRRL